MYISMQLKLKPTTNSKQKPKSKAEAEVDVDVEAKAEVRETWKQKRSMRAKMTIGIFHNFKYYLEMI